MRRNNKHEPRPGNKSDKRKKHRDGEKRKGRDPKPTGAEGYINKSELSSEPRLLRLQVSDSLEEL